MQGLFKHLISKLFKGISFSNIKEEGSFSLKKLIVDDNPYQKYGLAAAGGTVVSFASILLMALLAMAHHLATSQAMDLQSPQKML